MATTQDLIEQAAAADTSDQLDAIAAQAPADDQAVAQAVQIRRQELSGASGARARRVVSADPNPNLTTDPAEPKAHYYLATDGKTKINAWGEEKGSTEDKRRW